MLSNFEEHFQVFAGERLPCVLAGNDGLGHATLGLLQLENFFLHSILTYKLVGKDLSGLADAVCTIRCLTFHSRIPPGVVVDHVIGGSKVQSRAACLERNEEDGDVGTLVEAIHLFKAIFAGTIQIAEGKLGKL